MIKSFFFLALIYENNTRDSSQLFHNSFHPFIHASDYAKGARSGGWNDLGYKKSHYRLPPVFKSSVLLL
jgi:hypothetical protein